MLYSRPDLMHRILEVNAAAVTAYLNAQIDAGAQAVMLFDSWGGVLADGAFQRFSLDYTRRVVQGLQREKDGQRIPCIVFTKGGGLWLDEMAPLDCDVLGLDWTVNLGRARAAVGGQAGGPGKALQGNIDPNVLFANPQQIEAEVARTLQSFGTPHRAPAGDPDQVGPTPQLGHVGPPGLVAEVDGHEGARVDVLAPGEACGLGVGPEHRVVSDDADTEPSGLVGQCQVLALTGVSGARLEDRVPDGRGVAVPVHRRDADVGQGGELGAPLGVRRGGPADGGE
jgi:hypothetical protein